MTTLDDLKRVERELRDEAKRLRRGGFYTDAVAAIETIARADTIAAYIAAQRERDAAGVKVPDRIVGPFLNKGERDDAQVWNDCIDEVLRLNAQQPVEPVNEKEG